MFSVTILMEVQYSVSIQIQDLQLVNKWEIKWCERRLTIFQVVKPCSWLMFWRTHYLHFQGHKESRLLVGSSLQMQMGMFITKTAVSPLMPATSCQQTAQSLSMLSHCHAKTILCIIMPSYSTNKANLPCKGDGTVSPRCSCTVT